MPKSELQELTAEIIKFRDARRWKQFHNPKDCALSLVLEATEVMEHFQWKNSKEMAKHSRENKDEIADELADVLYWVLLISHDLGIDIYDAAKAKNKKNNMKYPVKKALGKHTKYAKL